jgi:hypothetical protein
LLAGLNSGNLDAEDVRQWSRYFDWLLLLSDEDDAEIDALLQKEKPVPYVTSWERRGEKKGRLEEIQSNLETVLEARFGPDAHSLYTEIRKGIDKPRLQELLKEAATIPSLDDFRALLG